jgi:energy-coupling factor transport system ATP-binding protein
LDLTLTSLSYTYPTGVAALRDVSLAIPAGEAVAIVGQNGAGKTTLAKHLNGLLRPSAGLVQVGDWNTRDHTTAQLAARVGYVFQNPEEQLFQQTVRAEVAFGPKNLGWGATRIEAEVEAALVAVALRDEAGRHPYDLSPGGRKRVALASVLAMDTPIVVLDEPTTGQDYAGIELVGRLADDLRGRGKTVITITHDIDFCAEHFGRVVALTEGQVLLDGPARDVLAQAETLARTYVEPPQLVRLAARLGMQGVPLNVEEFTRQALPPPPARPPGPTAEPSP